MTELRQAEHPGCYNREPFNDNYIVKDGMSTIMSAGKGVAAYKVKEIPFTGSRECHTNEPRCCGCVWVASQQKQLGVQ